MDRTAGWVLASIAMVVAVVLRASTLDEGHSSAYLVGAVLGAIAAGVLIGVVLRFGYVKLIRKDQEVWSPWVLVIAAVVSLLVAASRSGDDAVKAAATAAGKPRCEGQAQTAEELVATLPKGWNSAPADGKLIRSLEDDMPPGAVERVTGRAVGRGEPGAAVLVFEVGKPSGTDQFLGGIDEEAPGKGEDVPLGDARGKLYRTDDGGATVSGKIAPCAAMVIFGVSPDLTRRLAAELAVEPS